MTGDGEPRPPLLLAIGVPDGLDREEAVERFRGGKLPGVTGLSRALLPWLRRRGHPHVVTVFGADGVMTADAARRMIEQTGGRVLINLICEPYVQRLALDQVARFEQATGIAVVNSSRVVSATTRPLIARRLAGQAGVYVPRCTYFADGDLTLSEHIEAGGHTYPVLLRPPGGHGSEGMVRIDGPDALAGVAAAVRSCTVTDFVDFRSADGLWRKYRLVYAGDRLLRRHVLIDSDWNLVGAARRFMRDRPALLAEEHEWLQSQTTLDDDSIDARVLRQFRRLRLDFGAIDCALLPDGELVVFEINACLQITNVASRAISDRRPYEATNDDILGSLVAQACSRAGEPRVRR